MTTRTVTGTIQGPRGLAWAYADVTFELLTPFATHAAALVNQREVVATTDESGAFTAELQVPETHAWEWRCTLPDGNHFRFRLADGPPTTLQALVTEASLDLSVAAPTLDALLTLQLAPHLTDLGNPHQVTAVQVGADLLGSAAAVQASLDGHLADVGNPHGVSAAQIGADVVGSAAAVQANLDAHVANADRPHTINMGNGWFFFGPSAGGSYTYYSYNMAIGPYALQGSTASTSVAVGSYAGQNSAQGYNVSLGAYAGQNANAANTTNIGTHAGKNNTGSRTIALGYGTLSGNTHNDVIAMGYSAKATQSNQVIFGSNIGIYGRMNTLTLSSDIGGSNIELTGNTSLNVPKLMARISSEWQASSDATRRADLALYVHDFAEEREALRLRADGGRALVILNDLPTSDPGVTGAVWNDGGTLRISA